MGGVTFCCSEYRDDEGQPWYYLFIATSPAGLSITRDVDASIVRIARDHGDLGELILSVAANLERKIT